jgi:hypothetical protein
MVMKLTIFSFFIGAAMSLRHSVLLALFPLFLLSACERLGIADPAKEAAQKESDARQPAAPVAMPGARLKTAMHSIPMPPDRPCTPDGKR